METEQLKQEIKDKELRLSQLRSMDTHQLHKEDRELIGQLEQEIKELKTRLHETD
ncbi:hypothetical protein [Taibaiella koreensis]|uniref:hypothetical protein n=1 Tax=Taibaiella koreensis TaxID=1268548 RepID=UPI0013C335D9|nr:hypothetical protein [Taibaiella koreensis]